MDAEKIAVLLEGHGYTDAAKHVRELGADRAALDALERHVRMSFSARIYADGDRVRVTFERALTAPSLTRPTLRDVLGTLVAPASRASALMAEVEEACRR